jgi:peptidoglycan/xylan/chitin deacetylase (PgdA/CDA1 family)
MFYLVKSPWILKKYFSECTWNIKTNEKILYLTFDDGPHPEATSFVLEQLKNYNAKATFFCIGKNVKEHFEIYKQIISDGHRPANHTFSHLNGWKTDDEIYVRDIEKAAEIIDSDLFRPPYGRITKFQIKVLQQQKINLKTIMWDVLSGDFDTSIQPENCYLNVINNAKPGSIIVFHDSAKALQNIRYALPKVLEYYSEKGFKFHSLRADIL